MRRWLLAVPGRILHSGRRVVLRLAQGMLWAATFIAAYQLPASTPAHLQRLTASARVNIRVSNGILEHGRPRAPPRHAERQWQALR